MIDTPEKRRSAIDFAGIRGTGMPIPIGSIPAASRVHVLNLYSGIVPTPQKSYFWRNRNIISSLWVKNKTPQDGSTQIL